MLALQSQREKPQASMPNILPCRLHYSGPVKVTKRFWSPSRQHDNTKTSYFRGRKLRGKTIKLPPDYTGVAAKATEFLLPQQPRSFGKDAAGANAAESDAEDDDLDDKPEPAKILQSTTTFNEVTIWGHDMLPAADDPFVKGIEEWIVFAEAIHVEPIDTHPRNATTAWETLDS